MAQAVDEAGNIWEIDPQGGPPRFVGRQDSPQSNTLITKQANPVEQQGDVLKNQLTQVQIQKVIDELQKGDKPNLPTGYRMKQDGTAELIPGVVAPGAMQQPKLTAKERSDAIAQYIAADRVLRQQGVVQGLFDQSAGATDGLAGLADLLPTPKNDRLNTAGQRLRADMKKLQGFTGGEGNTLGEASLLYDPFLVSSRNLDQTAQDKIANMADIAKDARREAIMILGGVPDANGRITPIDQLENPLEMQDGQDSAGMMSPAGNIPPAQGPDRSAPLPAGPSFGGPQGDPSGFVPYGSKTRRMDNPQWAGVNEAVKGMIIAGQSSDAIRAYLGERGINTNVEGLNQAANYFRKTGKRDFRVNVDDIEVPMSGFEQFRNNAPQTAVGAGVASAANAVALGVPQALAPEQMQYIRDQNPFPSFVGDVAGIVGATSGISTVGNSLARSLAPRALTGGGRLGNAARAVAPDAAYGAAYGGITEGDPLTGAATAALGSGAGQMLGRGAGKLLGGLKIDPNAQTLRNMGMQNLTVGQMLGGTAKSLEDASTSAPVLGDIVNARHADALQEFNLGRFNDVAGRAGQTVNDIGETGLDQLGRIKSDAYTNATRGVSTSLDTEFAMGMKAASDAGQMLPADYQALFNKVGQNRIGPITDAGVLTGDSYQQAMRGLKASRKSAGQAAPGFEQEYRDSLTMAMDALRGQMERGGGQSVIDGLKNADAITREAKTLEKAVFAAKNDAGGAGVQVFTPAQLNTAAYATRSRFPGPRPFADVTDAAQMVLPSKIPDSGTARRGASLLLPASLGGTGAGLDLALGGFSDSPQEGAMSGATIGAMLALGGTKGGQKLLKSILFERGAKARRASGIFGGRKAQKALGGAVTAPFLIEN